MSDATASALSAILARPRWRREHAREVLQHWHSSGLPLAEFAQRHALHPVRLQRWQTRLSTPQTLSPRFQRVEVIDRPAAADSPSLVLVLRSHHRLEIGAGVDPATLASVIRTVEGVGC